MDEWRERAEEQQARRIERRKFLKGAAALSTLAMLETNSIAKALAGPWHGPLGGMTPSQIPLGPIVVTMMENRSLDHYLGWMGGAIDGIQQQSFPTALDTTGGCRSDGSAFPVANATPVDTYHLPGHCLASDPEHGWTASRVEFNGGRMNGFHHASGIDSLGYYNEADVPFLGWMAKNYVTFSRYFSSVMGPTYPNRIYWLAGQGGGFKNNVIPGPQLGFVPDDFTDGDPEPDGHDWACVFHQLDQAGIPWTYYHHDLATVMLFFNRVEENPGKVRFIADYFADAAAGLLTPIVFLDPSFVTIGNDDHPTRDIAFGQRYLYDTFMALAQSPQWWRPDNSLPSGGKGAAYIVTYDEAGGFFDHVPPPRVTDPNGSADHCEDWGRLGFRVPTVVSSPFTQHATVDQRLYDHTSILKFIQWRFGLGSLNDFAWNGGLLPFTNGVNLGSRDSAPEINNLAEVFNFGVARPDLPSEPPNIPLHPEGLFCAQSQFPDESNGENPLEPVPEIPAPPLARPDLPDYDPYDPYKRGPVVPHKEWIELADRGFFGKYDFRERAKHGVHRD
ncbi:MAG: alkaline phosphatase family protein [Actinomycetota bacterium]